MRVSCLALALALAGLSTAVALERLPNSTLQLPLNPPARGFSTTPAFPGLSFSGPICLASPPGETNRLFVCERAGRIVVITNLAAPTLTPFLDIRSRVNTAGEGGLLGLVFHPGYATNGCFFVYYTLTTSTAAETGFHDRLARFQVSPADPNQALPDSELPLFTQFDEAANHNGGDVQFGPDGYLYVSLGDEGGGGDNFRNSRRIDRDFFAAILRLDVDERPGSLPPNPHPAIGAGYAIPADNPFVGATNFNGAAVDPTNVRTEFWAVGLRNPWRMSFDPATGRLYCGDVGQGLWEEIDIIVRGGDYGWNYREGLHPYTGTPPANVTSVDPIWEYPHTGSSTNSGNSITGGVVYRGAKLSQLYGHYVFADYGSGHVWAFLYDGSQVTSFRHLTTESSIVEFGTDPSNGDILLASVSGTVLRLVYSDVSTGDPLPENLADTGAFADLLNLGVHPGILPYSLNVPFWSDHALKSRWFSVPDTNQLIGFDATGLWSFPTGTVWVKHFEIELTNGAPESRRRLETRFLVRNTEGSYGVTYRWDDTQTNAFLVAEEGLDEAFLVRDGMTVRTQVWHYPSRAECLVCHTPVAGHALGFSTAQLNREVNLEGSPTNQVLALAALGYFSNPVGDPAGWPAMANATNESATLEERARSYLAANCVQCHQPGGLARGYWDARHSTPLTQAGIVNGPVENDYGDPANKVLAPGSVEHSMIFQRIAQLGPGHMPPLATSEINTEAVELLRRWILDDVAIVTVSLSSQPLVYTEGDGLVPLDSQASVRLGPAVNLTNGTLTAVITAEAAPEDRLRVYSTGSGAGQISVSGNAVSYGGTPLGTILSEGSGTGALVVRLEAGLTVESLQALLRSVGYENLSATPSTATRRALVSLADTDGLASGADSREVVVRGVPAEPTITWSAPADVVYGMLLGSAQLNATTDVPGSFIYSPPFGAVLAAGPPRTLTVVFTPLDTVHYLSATGSVSLTVTPAALTVRAEDKTKVYGQPLPPFTAAYEGFVAGDTPASLATPPVYSTPATDASPVGSYPITVTGAAAPNYTITHLPGTLTIEANAVFESIHLRSGATLVVSLTGHPERIYRVQSSTNLATWIDTASLTAGLDGKAEWTTPIGSGDAKRFYRIVWP